MDRRRKMLVNIGEEEADSVLREVADRLGVRVLAKPRLADAVEIDGSGLSSDLYSYALKAHLDFVVTRGSDAKARFAVEFDGEYHETDAAAKRRDAMKDTICARLGLPLIRVNADFLQTVKGFRLLAWMVELWFLDEAVTDAQESGAVPWDRAFDAYSFVAPDARGAGFMRPYDLASDARAALWAAYGERRCLAPFPNHYFAATDVGGEAYAFLPVAEGRWLTSHIRVRAAFGIQLVTPGELASDLALVEIAAKLDEYERGVAVTATAEEVNAIADRCSGWSGGFFSPGSD